MKIIDGLRYEGLRFEDDWNYQGELVEGHKCNICGCYIDNAEKMIEHYDTHTLLDKELLSEYNQINKDTINTIALYETNFYKSQKK
jgi:hypothetical protein